MSITYTIDLDRNRIQTACSGDVGLMDVMEHFATLERDTDFRDGLDVLLDLTDLTSLPNSDQVMSAAVRAAGSARTITWGACAIAAPRDAQFGIARAFESFAADHFRITRVFRDKEQAEEWLSQTSNL